MAMRTGNRTRRKYDEFWTMVSATVKAILGTTINIRELSMLATVGISELDFSVEKFDSF